MFVFLKEQDGMEWDIVYRMGNTHFKGYGVKGKLGCCYSALIAKQCICIVAYIVIFGMCICCLVAPHFQPILNALSQLTMCFFPFPIPISIYTQTPFTCIITFLAFVFIFSKL